MCAFIYLRSFKAYGDSEGALVINITGAKTLLSILGILGG